MSKTAFKLQEYKGWHAHPWPIFTRLRYNRVGSASVQICCNRLIISASFALSSFFFSRRLGVTPAVEELGDSRADALTDAGGPGGRWSFVVSARMSVSL